MRATDPASHIENAVNAVARATQNLLATIKENAHAIELEHLGEIQAFLEDAVLEVCNEGAAAIEKANRTEIEEGGFRFSQRKSKASPAPEMRPLEVEIAPVKIEPTRLEAQVDVQSDRTGTTRPRLIPIGRLVGTKEILYDVERPKRTPSEEKFSRMNDPESDVGFIAE